MLPGHRVDLVALTLRRHGSLVLDLTNLTVKAGSLTAITGLHGSGKTALMRVLGGLAPSHGGRVLLDGEPLGRSAADRHDLGVVRQPDQLFPHLTLAENVALPLRRRGVKRDMRVGLARETLDLVQLEAPAGTRTGEAGLADLQRVLLARAAVSGPKLMLLDEPFPAADERSRLALIGALGRIHQVLGATIILATRNLRDALPVADQIAVLRAGRLEQAGAADAVFNRPATAFVATLCGETNRLPGTTRGREDDIATVQLACGPLVEARAADDLPRQGACVFMLRPEHIAVAPVAAAEMGDGALDATLIETQFWGDSYRLRLLIGSGAELVVRRPAIAGLRGLAPGRPCAVAWQSHHAMVFASPHS
jgi:putative spermidine/putrescine transport system ATP-binding protein